MGYIYKWIEGEKNLHDYCVKRFGERPRFIETIGRVGEAKVELIYKMKEGHGYVAMYLLYMQHPTGTIWDFNDLRRMSYEEIRADRTSIVMCGNNDVYFCCITDIMFNLGDYDLYKRH